MAKLTKPQTRAHNAALEILKKDKLTDDDREYVFRNFHPGANHLTGERGAFFTPFDLAGDHTLGLRGRILDLCAGIGVLSAFPYWRARYDVRDAEKLEITCIEKNPAYVEIGRKLCPWARWICADVFDVKPADLGRFDSVVSNPPFGRIARTGNAPRYTGPDFDLHIVDLAAEYAPFGYFILPSGSAPFRLSRAQTYRRLEAGRGVAFEKKTGARMEAHLGVDCDCYRDQWTDVAPKVELVEVDYENVKRDALTPLAKPALLAAE